MFLQTFYQLSLLNLVAKVGRIVEVSKEFV